MGHPRIPKTGETLSIQLLESELFPSVEVTEIFNLPQEVAIKVLGATIETATNLRNLTQESYSNKYIILTFRNLL